MIIFESDILFQTTTTVVKYDKLLKTGYFGLSNQIYSDCGTNFTSDEMKQFCKKNSIQQVFSSPYHHESNGIVERCIRSAKDMLYATAKERNEEWDKVIPIVELSLRSSKNSFTNLSPFEVIYGTNPRVTSFSIRKKNIYEKTHKR